jgi:hypothetical protein
VIPAEGPAVFAILLFASLVTWGAVTTALDIVRDRSEK